MDPLEALIDAVCGDDRQAIDAALREVPDVDARPTHAGSAALHHAAEEHSVEGIRALLAAGATVDLPDRDGNTPLHYATFDRDEDDEAIRLLRAAGADPDGARNRHPDAFDGQSVIAAYDDHGVILQAADSGVHALRRLWSETYAPGDGDDWEHVFTGLPAEVLMPVTLAWQIGRYENGSQGTPVQLAVLKLDTLPDPFPKPGQARYVDEGYDELGHLVRLPVARIPQAVRAGEIGDLETVTPARRLA